MKKVYYFFKYFLITITFNANAHLAGLKIFRKHQSFKPFHIFKDDREKIRH